jgi:hypothetical protein
VGMMDDQRPTTNGQQHMQRVTRNTQHSVELHIEALVLHDFPFSDRHRIGEAVRSALTRLFVEQGVPPSLAQGGAIAQLDAGALNLRSDVTADTIGAQVAQSVYRGLKR